MKVFKSIFVSFLASLVLLSSGGYGVFSHYCKGNLVGTSILIATDPCSKEKIEVQHDLACPHESTSSREKLHSDCCDDKVSFFQTDVFSFDVFEWESTADYIVNHAFIQLNTFRILHFNNPFFADDSPPLLSKLPIFLQIRRLLL